MTIREQVVSEINVLSETQLKEVSDYLKVLKFRRKRDAKNGGSENDSIFNLGLNPVECGAPDASGNLDEYLY